MELVNRLKQLIEDKKGENPVVLDVGSRCNYTDYLLIASGGSDRQLQAISDHLSHEAGQSPQSIEGYKGGEWILLDFGGVVVHLFHTNKRALYSLEKIWNDPTHAWDESVIAGEEELSPLDRKIRKMQRSFNSERGQQPV